MTIAVLVNNPTVDRYAVGRLLYAALPDFLCGSKEHRVQVCFRGFDVCIPRIAARFLIDRGAYLGGCGGKMLQNGDSLLIATLSPSELTSIGMQKNMDVQIWRNELTVSPNPVNKRATLTFKVAQSGITTLCIYDINGKQLSLLFNGMADKGVIRQVHFEAGNLPAGVYIAILQIKDSTIEKKPVIKR